MIVHLYKIKNLNGIKNGIKNRDAWYKGGVGMNGNCATDCKHSTNCERKEYKEWHNRNKNNTYSIYKDDFLVLS